MRQWVYVDGSPVVHVWLGERDIACGKKWAEISVCGVSGIARRCRACEAYVRGWLDRAEVET